MVIEFGVASSGSLEPVGEAFVRAVPVAPRDDGVFGPGSMVWRVHRGPGFLVAGLRALMLQALHPLAMAGVAQHSQWQRDPVGRLASTSGYVLTVTYGDTPTVAAAAQQVRRVHVSVRGQDTVTGLPYSAEDPRLLLWVHIGLVDSLLEVTQRYGRALDGSQADRYVAEMARFAELVGVPAGTAPDSTAALERALRSDDLLQTTDAAREAIAIVLDPPQIEAELGELWRDIGQVAIGTLPDWARDMYGFDPPPPDLLERDAVRQLLGTLDFAFETMPGVVDARRRIEMRVRAHTGSH
jgi:uncharacterized protein (DUF2236 family)